MSKLYFDIGFQSICRQFESNLIVTFTSSSMRNKSSIEIFSNFNYSSGKKNIFDFLMQIRLLVIINMKNLKPCNTWSGQ